MKKKWVLATSNEGKVKEMSEILNSLSIEVFPQAHFNVSDIEETGTTFVENAIIKARHAAKVTELPALADDSGLEVDYLLGKPGVYSARFAGQGASDQQNIDLLLAHLLGTEKKQRRARFRCLLVYMRHHLDPTPIICQGTWDGWIMETQRGKNGFGYDPIFWVESDQCSSAQLSKQRKHELSHRGQALALLIPKLKAQFG